MLIIINIDMFKPTLKRSKLQARLTSPSSKTSSTPAYETKYPYFAPNTDALSLLPQFLVDSPKYIFKQNRNTIFTPLASQQRQYPQQIGRALHQEINELDGRGIGYGYGIYWLYLRNRITFWIYQQGIPSVIKLKKTLELDSLIYAVSIGHIKNVEKHFSKKSFLLLAIGLTSTVELYQIDPMTLQLNEIFCKLTLDYGQSLQKVVFTLQNEIYYTGSSASLTQVQFNEAGIKKRSFHPYKKSYSPSFQKYNELNVENILVGRERIFCLVRREFEEMWLKYHFKSIWNFFCGRMNQNNGRRVVIKQIHVYKRHPKKGLEFQKIITSREIQEKIKNSFSYFEKHVMNHRKVLEIVSIYKVAGKKQENLGLITKQGYNITIDISQKDFVFCGEPDLVHGKLFFDQEEMSLIKPIQENVLSSLPSSTSIFYSTGVDGLTVFQDMCAYNYQNIVQVIKLSQIPGHITEALDYEREGQEKAEKWIVFEKNNLTILKKMTPQELILTYVSAEEELQVDKIIRNEFELYESFIKKMDRLSDYIGRVEFCHALYDILSSFIRKNQVTYPIIPDLKVLAKNELKAKEITQYNEWYYSVGRLPSPEPYALSSQRIHKIWKILCNYQYLNDNMRIKSDNNDEGLGSCWWICLRQQFFKILSPILNWTPKQFVLAENKLIKEETIQKLRVLEELVSMKRKNIRKINSDLEFTKKRIEEEKKKKEKEVADLNSVFKNNSTFYTQIMEDDQQQQTVQEENVKVSKITQSLEILEINLLMIIPKMLTLITYYQILAQCDRGGKILPTFEDFLVQIKARELTKSVMVEVFGKDAFEKSNLIQKFDKQLPELCFKNELFLYRHFERGIFQFSIEDLDAGTVAQKLNLQKITKIKEKLKEFPPKFIQILFERILFIEHQISMLEIEAKAKSQNVTTQPKNIMSVGKEKVCLQLKEIFMKQYEDIKNFLIEELAKQARTTHETRGENFELVEKHFSLIIERVANFKDKTYCIELERFLIEEKILPQQLLKLKGYDPQNIYPLAATSQVQKTQGPEIMNSLDLMSLFETKYRGNTALDQTPFTNK